jgi:hypothetical protein
MSGDQAARQTNRARGRWHRGGRLAVVGALAAAVTWWATFPVSAGGGGTRIALVVAITSGTMSVARLALAGTVARQAGRFTVADRVTAQLVSVIEALPWAEFMTVAAIVLEALHRSSPWHTGVLAVALTGYLLALHLGETDADAGVLRAQLPLLAAGAALLAIAIGVATLPDLPAGPAAVALRISAVVLAVVAAALAAPAWIGRGR